MAKLLTMPKRCPDCGSTEVTWDENEEVVDCFGCGIWFDPDAPENIGCLEDPEAA